MGIRPQNPQNGRKHPAQIRRRGLLSGYLAHTGVGMEHLYSIEAG